MSKPWPMIQLGEILTERQEMPLPEDIVSGRIKILSKISFDTGQIYIRPNGETRTGMILIRPGDLVVSGINAAKGAIAIYGLDNAKPVAATIHYGAYIPNSARINVTFLWWLLRSMFFRELLAEYLPGGIKTELKAKRLLPVPVPLPSLEEQQQIVARVEKLASQIRECMEINGEAILETEALIVAFLRKVSAEIRVDGTLSDALLAPPRNGWSAKCDSDEKGIAILSLGAVTGFHYRTTEFKRISPLTPLNRDVLLKSGDLLITRSNTPNLVGHAAIYNGEPSPCIYPDLMMRLQIQASYFQPRFVWYWLQMPFVREFLKQKAKGTSPTMKKISQGVVMAIPFPSTLSISEQNRIVEELDSQKTKIDMLKRIQTDVTAELEALLPSVLDYAFKGEL